MLSLVAVSAPVISISSSFSSSCVKRLKALEDENAKLKKLLAEAMLEIALLKDINSRKW